ncbi:MAG TPA: ATP-binding protein [Polyangiales bacterium]
MPVWLALGAELELIYNDGFGELCGCAADETLPLPIRVAWQDAWSGQLEALIARALVSERVASCPLRVTSRRQLNIAFSALHDDLGRPIGIFGSAFHGPFVEHELILLHELFRQGLRIRRVDEAVAACSAALPGVITPDGFAGLYLIDQELGVAVRCGQAGGVGGEQSNLPRQLPVPSEPMQVERWVSALAASISKETQLDLDATYGGLILEHGELRGVLVAGDGATAPLHSKRELLRAMAVHAGELIAYVNLRARSQGDHPLAEPHVSADDFAINLSRQLRGPLGLLLKEIDDLLTAGKVSPDALAQLRVARRRARRLARLVDMLRELFLFDGQNARPRLRPINIAAATRRLCELFRPAFEQAQIEFSVECAPLPDPAWVDRELWEKIICNLLANALKFTLKGEVRVVLGGTLTELVLTVSDTGCGIHEADIPLVFDRFFAGRPRLARSEEGAGVGLSWVRELVRLHDGTIRVASALGRGSSFTVRIPYRREEAAHSATDEPLEPLGSDEAPDTLEAMQEWSLAANEADSLADTRILIAEGDVQTQTYLRALLGARWLVDVVRDADSAVAKAIERKPALVLADIETADIDGVELARRLHEEPQTAEIPVILVCGRQSERQSIEGLGAGALDYVVKPLSSRELVARVEARLSQARAQRAERAAREAAERESLMKDQVIALVAHELRTPLSAILGWLQVLREEGQATPSRRTKALEVIERNANTQARLLRDLFDVSRMVTGKFELELQLTPTVNELIESAIEALIPAAKKSDVRLETELADDVGPVLIDPQRMHQLIWNLVSNALKFTPPGGSVRIVCSRSAERAILQVIDTGKGISREFLPHVFERFSQEGAERAGRGLGLGLAISRCIVELHGGTISVQSEGEQRGTTFTVSLPRVATALHA